MSTDNKISSEEIKKLDKLLAQHVDVRRYHLGSDDRGAASYDRRPQMYGGDGVVYLLQMFAAGELVNNRIGAYMVLPTSADSVGFHTHGTRKEQELYIIMNGQGEYHEKATSDSEPTIHNLKKGNITSLKGEAFHAIKNTGDEALVIFVVTTFE